MCSRESNPIDYDTRSRLRQQTRSSGLNGNDETLVEKFDYDANGNIILRVDSRGVRMETDYDLVNRVKESRQETAVPGQTEGQSGGLDVTRYRYNAAGNLINIFDPRGAFFDATFGYDARNHRVTETQNSGTPERPGPVVTWTSVYDAAGNLIRRQDPRGSEFATINVYDSLNRLAEMTTPRGLPGQNLPPAVERYFYDSVGNLERVESPRQGATGLPFTTKYFHDPNGRQIKVVDAEGFVSEFGYDFNGNPLFEKQHAIAGGNAASSLDRELTYSYDHNDRLFQLIDGEHFITTYTYDEVGNKIKSRGPYRNSDGTPAITTYVYDAANRLRSEVDAEGGVQVLGYDGVGNVISDQDPRGPFDAIRTKYDGLNRPLQIEQPTGTPESPGPVSVRKFCYERSGQRVIETDARGDNFAIVRTFTVSRLPASVEQPSGRESASQERQLEQWFPDG